MIRKEAYQDKAIKPRHSMLYVTS